MQITSFQKTLLGIGGGLAVIGGGVGLIVARNHRKDEEAAAYRATPVSVEDFVDKAITAYDLGTYGDPLVPRAGSDEDRRKLDGVLHVGVEDTLTDRRQFYGELVPHTDASYDYYFRQTGRDFLRAADADKDGGVTRDELVAAVKPYAGSDGKLDEAERRKVLVDGKLGIEVDTSERTPIAGWEGGDVSTAATAAELVLRDYRDRDKPLLDEGSRAVKIADVEPVIPWTTWDRNELRTGPITSAQPALAKIDDEHGNGNGLVSEREVATWIATEFRDDSLLSGHVKEDYDGWKAAIDPQEIGRVDASTLSGKVFYAADLPKADLDRFYGGNVPNYVDGFHDFRKYRGDAEWQPDPA